MLTQSNLQTYILNNFYSLLHPLEAPTTANNDVNTTALETTLYSVTVPANAMGTVGAVSMTLLGDYLHNNVAGDTLTLRIKFGGITHYAVASSLGNATGAARHPWLLNILLLNKGATNSQELFGTLITEQANAGAPTTGIGFVVDASLRTPTSAFASTAGGMTIDTTVNQTLLVSVQWSASSANNSWRRRWAGTLIGQN